MLFSFALTPLDQAIAHYQRKHDQLPERVVMSMTQLERVLERGLMSGVPHEQTLESGVIACWHYNSVPDLLYRLGPLP